MSQVGVKERSKEIIFFIACSLIILASYILYDWTLPITSVHWLRYYLAFIIGAFLSLILIRTAFNRREDKIKADKKLLRPFIVIESSIIIAGLILFHFLRLKADTTVAVVNDLIYLCIIICINSFVIKLRHFKFNITINHLLIVVAAIAIMYSVKYLFYNHSFQIGAYSNAANFLAVQSLSFIHPPFFEELLFRGILIAGLKGYGLKEININIIQAVLFGLAHFMYDGNINLLNLLGTSHQMVIGYLLGLIYLKSSSLTPGILFHYLYNLLL